MRFQCLDVKKVRNTLTGPFSLGGGGQEVKKESKRVILTHFIQESPRQTKPKKGPNRKVHEFRPFL